MSKITFTCQDVKCGREFDLEKYRARKATDGQLYAVCTRCRNIALDESYKSREVLLKEAGE